MTTSDQQLDLSLKAQSKQTRSAPPLHHRWQALNPSVIFDEYWKFAVERQEIFYKRFKGEEAPWSNNPILAAHKFTNAYRASDRVSQYLIKNVISSGEQSFGEIFFRTILFKFFNKIETWELFQNAFGTVTSEGFSVSLYDKVLTTAISRGQRIYSAAYIMPTGGRGTSFVRKHHLHLNLLARMMDDKLPDKIVNAGTMRAAFNLLKAYPTIGDFLAYQYVTDLNYSEALRFDEMDFVVAGPGAKDGIHKCFHSPSLSDEDIIRMMADCQCDEFERLGLRFQNLWGRPLQLIDCQNLFCEISKYSRVSHPEVAGLTGRTRIKQKFSASKGILPYCYPKWWGINEKIQSPK